jgi:hypothetical protein
MLDEDDRNKGIVMAAIRCGESEDEIRSKFKISTGTLTAIKTEYEEIKNQLDNLRAVSEIAEELQCSEEFVEEVKHIIETDVETLFKEVMAAPEQQQQKSKSQGKKESKAKGIDKNLKKVGEEQTAAVLVGDAGDIAKEVAIQRQDLGKFAMEVMGTVAMQFGYKDLKAFLKDDVFDFWLKYQGRIREMEALIEELKTINQYLQEAIERDMIGLYIAKCLDRITVSAMIGGGELDPDKLYAYKKVLLTDPVFLKQLYDVIHNVPADSGKLKEGEVEAYAT